MYIKTEPSVQLLWTYSDSYVAPFCYHKLKLHSVCHHIRQKDSKFLDKKEQTYCNITMRGHPFNTLTNPTLKPES